MEKLSGAQKMAVVEVFTGLLIRRKLSLAGAIATSMVENKAGNRQTGEKSSPVSSASSEAIPDGGSKKRRQR